MVILFNLYIIFQHLFYESKIIYLYFVVLHFSFDTIVVTDIFEIEVLAFTVKV